MDAIRGLRAITSLYKRIDRNEYPRFLRRNLTQALDNHEREFAEDTKPDTPSKIDAQPADSNLASSCLERQIHCERDDQEEHLLSGDAMPVLHIKSLHFRLDEGHNRIPESNDSITRRDGPRWLPRPGERIVPCYFTVAIYDLSSRHPSYYDSVDAKIALPQGKPPSNIEIQLTKPFRVSIAQFHVDATDGHSWRRELGDNYNLELVLHFYNSDEASEVLSQLEGHSKDTYSGRPCKESVIKASWTGLPDLPRPGEVLDLKRIRGHHSLKLRYGIVANMAWNNRVSGLVRLNRAQQSQRRYVTPHLPTPVSDDMNTKTQTMVKWVFRQAFENQNMNTTGLKCILCPRKREFRSFDRLRLHLTTHHDLIKFEVQDEPHENLKVIRMQLDKERAPQASEAEREIEWHRPKRKFDIMAYLDGDSDWNLTTGPKESSKPPASKAKGKTPQELPKLPSIQPIVTATRGSKTLAPEDVQDLHRPKRKKHVVPLVKGVTFYRTTSKQKVEPGAEVSDSDEDIDEFWLAQRQRQDTAKLGIDKTGQEFHEMFNMHLDEEQPMSDVLTRDAVVRFARKYANRLVQPAWRKLFAAKLDQLEARRIIGKDTVAYCEGLLDNVAETEADPSRVKGQPDDADEGKTPSQSRSGRRGQSKSGGLSSAEKSHNSKGSLSAKDALNKKRKLSQRDDDNVDMSTPKRRGTAQRSDVTDTIPESPSTTQSSKNRLRWQKGRMDLQEERTEQDAPRSVDDEDVFGRRMIYCTRNHQYLQSRRMRTSELVKTSHFLTGKPADQRQATDLDWQIFVNRLKADLGYDADVEQIVTDFNEDGGNEIVGHEADWHRVLRRQQDSSVGPIMFMIVPREKVAAGKQRLTGASEQKQKQNSAKACVCGQVVMSLRKTIACSNAQCKRVFHMECVSLQRRSMDWRCVDCSS